MNQALVLGQRALREALRTPEALIPTLFIPLFFLVVNVGQAGQDLPVGVDAVPRGPELRRLPAAERAAARGVVRQRRALPRRGHRGRLLRQAPGGAGLAHGASCSAACSPRRLKSVVITAVIVLRGAALRHLASPAASLGFVLLLVLTAAVGGRLLRASCSSSP